MGRTAVPAHGMRRLPGSCVVSMFVSLWHSLARVPTVATISPKSVSRAYAVARAESSGSGCRSSRSRRRWAEAMSAVQCASMMPATTRSLATRRFAHVVFNCLNYGYCEALRFATSLRNHGHQRPEAGQRHCGALRFPTSFWEGAPSLYSTWSLVLRSFTLRNFIEERESTSIESSVMISRSFTLPNFIEDG